MPNDKFYITTAIDYINAKPHIGHAYEKVASDALARFYAEKIGRDKVRFLTGTDEHGAKIARAAEEAGKSVEEFAAETTAKFKFAWRELNVGYDRFIRTTDEDHIKTVQDLLVKIKNNGHLYEADYSGYYCTQCETFYTETEVPDHICPIHKIPLELITEKNWFLKIETFTDKIKSKIQNDELKIWPQAAKNEVLSWLGQGFHDIAISRPNVKWGIPLPWDKEQTVYVWVDALINYVSGAKDNGKDWWPASLHVIGKDISKFHCIIWPAILLAAGLDLPKQVVVHGYLTVGGEKMSKSVGNVIDPNDWVAKYGSDAVRYLLLREVAFGQDGDVSEEKLKARYEGDLANGLGNLVSRVTNLIEKFDIRIVLAKPLERDEINKAIKEYRFHEALALIWQLVIEGNKIVDEYKLWDLAKTDLDSFRSHCETVVLLLASAARYLKPLLPETSKKILEIVSAEKIVKAEPLFPKVE